jgi:hypothetical protein
VAPPVIVTPWCISATRVGDERSITTVGRPHVVSEHQPVGPGDVGPRDPNSATSVSVTSSASQAGTAGDQRAVGVQHALGAAVVPEVV